VIKKQKNICFSLFLPENSNLSGLLEIADMKINIQGNIFVTNKA
jgi:hypothetical protein